MPNYNKYAQLKEAENEVDIVFDRIKERKKEIAEQPDLVDESFCAEIRVDMLSKSEQSQLEEHVGALDDKPSEEYVAETYYGIYRGDYDAVGKAYYTRNVVLDKATSSYAFEGGYLKFDIGFKLVVVHHSDWDSFPIETEREDEYLRCFTEMTLEDWEKLDS